MNYDLYLCLTQSIYTWVCYEDKDDYKNILPIEVGYRYKAHFGI